MIHACEMMCVCAGSAGAMAQSELRRSIHSVDSRESSASVRGVCSAVTNELLLTNVLLAPCWLASVHCCRDCCEH